MQRSRIYRHRTDPDRVNPKRVNRHRLARRMMPVLGALILFAPVVLLGQPPVVQFQGRIRGRVIIQQNGQVRQQLFINNQQAFMQPVRTGEPAGVYPEPPPLPSRPPIPAQRIDQLAHDLSSASYRDRAEATRSLKTGGVATARKMAEILQSDSAETTRRALSILESLFLCEDEEVTRVVDEIFSQIIQSEESPIASIVQGILDQHSGLRTRRAIRTLELDGAQIEYRTDIMEIDDRTGELYPHIGLIRFDNRWKGGAEGLKQLDRISGLGSNFSQIYHMANCPLDEETFLAAVKKYAPNVSPDKINTRGRAQLGIRFQENLGSEKPGILVTDAPAGLAAAEAGIIPGDLITKLNQIELKKPSDLTDKLKNFAPGDEIEVTLIRNRPAEQELTVKVKLKGWDSQNRNKPENDD